MWKGEIKKVYNFQLSTFSLKADFLAKMFHSDFKSQ